MTNMTLSPMQHEYVTRKELNGLKSYMDEGLDMTNKHIDNLEVHMDKKFANLESKMDAKFTSLQKHIDARFISVEDSISEISKVVNKISAKIL